MIDKLIKQKQLIGIINRLLENTEINNQIREGIIPLIQKQTSNELINEELFVNVYSFLTNIDNYEISKNGNLKLQSKDFKLLIKQGKLLEVQMLSFNNLSVKTIVQFLPNQIIKFIQKESDISESQTTVFKTKIYKDNRFIYQYYRLVSNFDYFGKDRIIREETTKVYPNGKTIIERTFSNSKNGIIEVDNDYVVNDYSEIPPFNDLCYKDKEFTWNSEVTNFDTYETKIKKFINKYYK